MPIKSPMLAVNCSDLSKLTYPILCTPKLDGIRCLILPGEDGKERPVSRKFKDIPNRWIRGELQRDAFIGMDGELMIRDSNSFQAVSSAVMREDGQPDFVYSVFDWVGERGIEQPYHERMAHLASMIDPPATLRLILPVVIKDEEALFCFEKQCLGAGYEGVMIRKPNGPYKCGRSTEKEGYLLKLKRFEDSEAVVIGFEERMHNGNEKQEDAFGRAKRSSHQENMVPMGTLGALVVRDIKTGVEFSLGTGYDDALRAAIWARRDTNLLGDIVKYKSQPTGVKEKPRFPVFLGFRDARDM